MRCEMVTYVWATLQGTKVGRVRKVALIKENAANFSAKMNG